MTDVQVGDRVRVTYEGVVDYVADNGCVFSIKDGRHHYPPAFAITTEILERRKPQVGDWIEGVEAYDSLPLGAMAGEGREFVLRTKTGFSNSYGSVHPLGSHSALRQIVYLPE